MAQEHTDWPRERLIELLSSYLPRGPELARETIGQLDLPCRGGFRAPDKILIVLFASRSGSNFLGQLLSATGAFREIGESFRPSQLQKIRDRHGLAHLHEAAQWMIDHRGTPNAFGFKAGFTVLMAAAELGFLSEVVDRAQLVLLRRRNRVAQAISLVISQLAGRTHSGQPVRYAVSDEDYDRSAIAFQLGLIEQREEQFADLACRLGRQPLVFYYEDLCADPERHVAAVCEAMGVPLPEDYRPEVRVKVLRDELSSRWAARFRAETTAGAGD